MMMSSVGYFSQNHHVVGYHHDAEVAVWSLQHEVHGCVLDLTGEFGIGLTSDLVLEGEVFDVLGLDK